MLSRLGGGLARRRHWVLAAWVLATAAGAVLGGSVYDRTDTLESSRPGLESTQVHERIDELDPQGESVVAVIAGREFFATDLVSQASRIMFEIREIDGVSEVTDAYTSGGVIGDDGQSSLVVVELERGLSEDEALSVAGEVAEALRAIDAPQVLVGGELLAGQAFAEQAIADTVRGELIALGFLAVALLLVLGGLRAAAVPLAAALAVIATTLLALSALAGLVPVSEYAVNVVTLLGIGLAVDYSLLMVFRFREERAADRKAPLDVLLSRTTAAAGRAVLVSGLAVATAMLGLYVFADPLLSAMALGGVLVVVLATVAGLTLVPALIAVAHRQIPARGARTWVWRRPARPRGGAGVLAGLAGFAQRRPVLVALAGVGTLLVLAAPVLQLQLANSDASALPPGSEERRTAEVIEADFDEARQPLSVLVEGDPEVAQVQRLLEDLEDLPGADEVFVRDDLDGVTWLEVVPEGRQTDPEAQELVRDVRALGGLPLLVGGPAAELVDAKHATVDRLPLALALVLLATFVLLLVLTGSVVVPLKALLLNLLTLAATGGVLVAIFQWGWGSGLLGFEPWGAIDLTTPLLLSLFVFGLSMDYEVFLLSRIKEEWDRRRDDTHAANDRAVLAGITATGPVVSAAAVCIGIVFLGFAFGELVAVKEIGVGMTVAVLLDVTVVRGLLLPASMSLLGRRNWWRPFVPLAAPAPAAGRSRKVSTEH
ncbi:MMPL family transporter [Nocardioides sp. cx-173]|uniref:MMPL family transporter n=1 Tax=Nocardioides sp. cx-173 TaxID=2898796 RepID=UPI001E47BEF2|nr:MMPL family transporter [Nocardioides sp. cx-173]UGB42291.1 MMPL family transporter [Nocardioides sp. cx-173]